MATKDKVVSIKVCDFCGKTEDTHVIRKCSICSKDVCREHYTLYHIRIRDQVGGDDYEFHLCKDCNKDHPLPALCKKLFGKK